MRYLWITWICLAAVPMAVAQQHVEEQFIEAIPHVTTPHAGALGHAEAGAVEAIPHSSTPHQGFDLIAQQEEPTTYLGVRLDPEPLPELLVKHLRLEPETGLRIQNVLVGSPADKIGLEQDDLIVALEGKPVREFEKFVESIRNLDAGKSVELKIIHLGDTKTVKATLETSKPGHEEWKYALEPEISYSWNPGRVFRMQPGQKNWLEVPMEKLPDVNSYFKKFMQEMYSFSHSEDGKNITVTIEGSPSDPQTQITVKSDETEFSTTVEKIDKLPEPYNKMARKDLDSARKAAKSKQRPLQWNELQQRKQPATPPVPFDELKVPPKGGDSESTNKVERQLKDLQKRLEQMERDHRKSLKDLQDELQKMQKAEPKSSGDSAT